MFKMFKNSVSVGLLALTVRLCGCGGCFQKPQAADVKDPYDSNNLDRMGLKMLWQRDLPLFTGDSIHNMLTLGQNLYVTTSNKAMYCISSQTGNPVWGLRVTSASEQLFNPVLVENVKLSPSPLPPSQVAHPTEMHKLEAYDVIVVNTPSHLFAIDNKTGNILRDIELGFIASQGAACEGVVAEVPGERETINEVNLLFGAPGKSSYIGIEMDVPVMFSQGNFYFAGTNGQVLGYDSTTVYTRMWSFDVQGAVKTPGVANYRGVFVASNDRRIYGLDIATGHRLWQPVRLSGDFVGPMTADSDRLYQFVDGVGLVAIDMNDGKIAWTVADGLMVLGCFDDKVYVLSRSRELLAIRAGSGELLSKASLKAFNRFAANTTLRGIYASTAGGKTACISPKDAESITVEMLKSK